MDHWGFGIFMIIMMLVPWLVLTLEELTAPFLFYTPDLVIAMFFGELITRILSSISRRGNRGRSQRWAWYSDTVFDMLYKMGLFMVFGVEEESAEGSVLEL